MTGQPVSRQRSFDELGTPLFDVTFCVLDLETTGGSPADCAITEIGAVRYRGGELLGTFHTLVNPGRQIPPFITILTGITQAMVIAAPMVDEALPTFLEFLGKDVVVGHNVRFDLSFLNADAVRLGYGRLANRSVDTAGLARRLIRSEVRNLKLSTLASHFRSPDPPTHRALDDAKATAHVFHALLERAGTVGVTALEDLLQLPTARGSAQYGKIRLADALPRRPGVYSFLDRHGSVFYIGKAKNLRTRVRSYFYGDTRRTVTNMLNELAAVDHRECRTELEAQVTELRLIHAHRPRYNRRSRPPKASHWVKLTREAFPRLSLARTWQGDGVVLGPFRSRRAAELVMHALWDATPIRRCTGRPGSRAAPCVAAQMGLAACPCDGRLAADDYAAVVELLRTGVAHRPEVLLDRLAERMREMAALQRYEEAGWVRDRHRALARALQRRRAWQAMTSAGLVWAVGADGDGAIIDCGLLVEAWRSGEQPPMLAAGSPGSDPPPPVPPSVETAEEAHLVWTWLTRPGTVLLDAAGPLALPAAPVPVLAA